MIYNFIWNYMPITFQIVGYALLLITIYCCYEAYFKIKKNKGYIYIAIICLILLLPNIIKILFPISVTHELTREYAQRKSNTKISPLRVIKHIEWHLPIVELLLLLAVLKFSIKDEKDNPNQEATGNPASPDTRA